MLPLPRVPHHPGFGSLGLPELLTLFVVALILFGFARLRR